MPNPVTWFEIVGKEPIQLQKFYADTFGWKLSPPVPEMGKPPPVPGNKCASGRCRRVRPVLRPFLSHPPHTPAIASSLPWCQARSYSGIPSRNAGFSTLPGISPRLAISSGVVTMTSLGACQPARPHEPKTLGH